MLKLQLLVITIIFLCALATISSTSKDYVVVGNKNTQNDEVMLHLNTNQNQCEQGFQDQQDTLKKKNQTSKFTGVYWNRTKKKCYVQLTHNKRLYYGGLFDNEEQAAMKVNLLCDKYEIERKNPTIDIKLNETQQKNQTSKFTGVSWLKYRKKWQAQLVHDTKTYYGGIFDNEEQAAMEVNLLCDKYEIKRKNLTIDIKPNVMQQNFRNKTSLYNGVSWNKKDKKWQVQLTHNKKKYHGGLFDNEEYAAMEVNLLCDKYEMERKNPTINTKPNAIQQKPRNKTSIYTGVCWHNDNKKWAANLKHNGKQCYGGYSDNEEHAAMKVNLLCDKYAIDRKNPTINTKPTNTKRKRKNHSIGNDDVMKEKVEITTPNHNKSEVLDEIRKE